MISYRTSWSSWVTPRGLRSAPIHRWYAFPHSFTYELVDALIDEWELDERDHIADPFVGAGTTLVSSGLRGIPATGFDLSPLAVFVTNVKSATYEQERLKKLWAQLLPKIKRAKYSPVPLEDQPELIRCALPGRILDKLCHIKQAVADLPTN